MSNDSRAGLAEPLVRAGLLGMPVRIEEHANRTAAGQARDGFHERIGSAGGSPIDEQDAVSIGLRDNIGFSGNSHDEQIVGQSQRAGAFGHCLRLCPTKAQHRCAQNKSRRTANRGLQYLSTCLTPYDLIHHDFPYPLDYHLAVTRLTSEMALSTKFAESSQALSQTGAGGVLVTPQSPITW